MKRIRVLHLITRLIVGGAQENTMYTAALLDRQRYAVEVVSGPQTGSEGSLIEEVRSHGIPLTLLTDLRREVSPAHDILALLKLARLMRRNEYAIVHTHSSKAGILGRIAARLAGIPIVIHTVHGWSFHDHMAPRVRNTYIFLEKLAARFTDSAIVVAQQDIEKGLCQGIGQPGHYRLIRSAIPLDVFDPGQFDQAKVRQGLGLPLDVPVLGNVGRFSAQKNPLEWVQVAGQVAQVLSDCHFLLVGDGPLRAQVEALLLEKGLTERTVLPGLRRDIPEMLAAIDVFLLTSLWEGLPRVIPQALAMGVPVVANRVDGSAEAIIEGETGFLCQAGNSECLSRCCVELLKNPGRRQVMGRNGRSFVQREFDLQVMVAQIANLYEELLNAKGMGYPRLAEKH